MDISVNYLAVVLAAVANMALGFLWYGPLFGKSWQRMMGFTAESMKTMAMTPFAAMVGGFVGALVMAFVLAHVIVLGNAFYGTGGVSSALMGGFWSWFGFLVPVTAGSFLWEGKSAKLWVLNAGYWLVAILLMSAILGWFA